MSRAKEVGNREEEVKPMLRRAALTAALTAASVLLVPAGTAFADHTDPGTPLSPVTPQPGAGALTAGAGEWEFIGNVGPMQGTDLEFFRKGDTTYVSAGTLGQAASGTPGFVGQRIVKLKDGSGEVAPEVVADHGSARCDANSSATGLQHDVQAVPRVETELLIDTTDATGRCHDTPGGGIEIIDVTGLGEDGFEPREIGLVRFQGLTHTVTADATMDGILYNNGSDFGGMPWTDVVDVRSCLGLAGKSLEDKRDACRPQVYRIAYQPEWSSKQNPDGTLSEPANCHDITAAPGRLYCAGLNATLVFDVTGLLGPDGAVKGDPLPCTVVDGTRTGAKVTDCTLTTSANPSGTAATAAWEQAGRPVATGARFLGSVNHPGRDCSPVPATTCNNNLVVRSDEGVAISHEADPTPDGRFMFVTDERGGGIVPPGATCAPGLDNPVGNGGIHVFDISDPANPTYALQPDGSKAVWIGGSPTPSPVFCTVHVIEQVPGEARIVAGYYDGGTKIVDYTVDEDGRWTFEEVAAYRLPGANTWASEVFDVVDNGDGTSTYYFASTSFALGEGSARGVDVFSWTSEPNLLADAVASERGKAKKDKKPKKDKEPKDNGDRADDGLLAAGWLPGAGPGSSDPLLLLAAAVVLPLAVLVRRSRRRAPEVAATA